MIKICSMLFMLLAFINSISFAEYIQEKEKRGIVRIETPDGDLGTGFLVFYDQNAAYLVTNKHVLKSCKTNDYFDSVFIRQNALSEDGYVKSTPERRPLFLKFQEQCIVREHSNPDIDLALVPIGIIELNGKVINNTLKNDDTTYIYGFSAAKLATRQAVRQYNIGAGTDAQIIGFSFKIADSNQYHICRFGKVALFTREAFPAVFKLKCPADNMYDTLFAEWCVLDLISRGGDSGAPVITFPEGLNQYLITGVVNGNLTNLEVCYSIPAYYILDIMERYSGIWAKDVSK